jgi:hypothetical protein
VVFLEGGEGHGLPIGYPDLHTVGVGKMPLLDKIHPIRLVEGRPNQVIQGVEPLILPVGGRCQADFDMGFELVDDLFVLVGWQALNLV